MKIKSINKNKEKSLTLDLEVNGTHTYQLANKVVTHNTSSLVLGTSSGIHAWFAKYYIRRMRIGKNEALYNYLAVNHPELIVDDYFRPHDTAIIEVPQKAPADAITRSESIFAFLERIKKFNTKWVYSGHRKGENCNNVSATVFIKDNEWELVGEWMWENRKYYNGLSILPYDGGSYIQAPFEEISAEEYEKRFAHLSDVDVTKIFENADNTDLSGEIACGSGGCELR
jgi:ribonucleoside-diphosphate reductase alpha chain